MSRKPSGPRSCPDIASRERFAQKLYQAAVQSRDPQRIALTCAATCQLLLGADEMMPGLLHDVLVHLSTADDPAKLLAMLWEEQTRSVPYLAPVVNGLVSWVDTANERDVEAARAVLTILADYDWGRCVDEADGELLGQLYPFMVSRSKVKSLGIFYTPMTVSKTIAAMQGAVEGDRILDPTCGAGGMLVATALDMRERGLDPRKAHFSAIDIDPIAAALCAVNLASRGLPDVVVECRNALAPPQVNPLDGEQVAS